MGKPIEQQNIKACVHPEESKLIFFFVFFCFLVILTLNPHGKPFTVLTSKCHLDIQIL